MRSHTTMPPAGLSPSGFPGRLVLSTAALPVKMLTYLSFRKTRCYDASRFFGGQKVSYPGSVGEYRMIDRQRLHDDAYRWEVVAALMRDHASAIMQYCLTWLGTGLAEEVTQDVFVTAWQGLTRYQPEASLRTWLFGIAHHKCQQAYRNRARRQAIAQTFGDEIQSRVHMEESTTPEDLLTHAAEQARLHDQLTQLPNEDRILLTLWYWKELPVAEIAEIMGKPEAAIRKRLTVGSRPFPASCRSLCWSLDRRWTPQSPCRSVRRAGSVRHNWE
jgi:RNA polymerase sigma-70 factor (ECF subfamily)